MVFLSTLFTSNWQKNKVIQPTGDVITTEGETVTLDCTFETSVSSNAYLFWYKQEVNDFPKYMLKRFSKTEENAPEFQKDRFDAKINKTLVPLKIQKLQLSDSAVYYCALRPTVTGNTKTLYKNLWSKDNTILHNIHQKESHTVQIQSIYSLE
uniref:Ig-like domain-containing protein n=1 Tax=Sander lucioperca TaxID=283035 RepID=A0A8C9ZJY7_SANLU